MKNIVKFALFGDENDYLYFGIKELKDLETLTDKGSLLAVIQPFASGDVSIEFLVSVLKIGLAKCYKEFNKDIQGVDALFEEHIGEYAFMDFVRVAFNAIMESGIMGNPTKAVEKTAKAKASR